MISEPQSSLNLVAECECMRAGPVIRTLSNGVRAGVLVFCFVAQCLGQPTKSTTLSGVVLDPSGARIANASLHLHSNSVTLDTTTDSTGRYILKAPPATYDLTVEAQGFQPYSRAGVVISTPTIVLDVSLKIANVAQAMDVSPDAALSTDASENRSALVFKGDRLDTLSDDPSVLQQQLLALSGNDPSSPAQIYVDGFSNGTLPPKDSIREIHINQNPFAAEYDRFGLGRIEVFTKPGGDKLHGSFDAYFGASELDAKNPYAGAEPSYVNDMTNASLNGPLGKQTSFYLSAQRSEIPANAIVNATTLDANLSPIAISEPISNRSVSQNYSVRGDRQFGKTDTVIARYIFANITQPNYGIGSLVLPSQAAASGIRTQTLQLTDTHIFNAKVAMDAAFQYIRRRQQLNGISSDPSIVVQGAFSAGGSPSQVLRDNQDRYEIRDYLSISQGNHFIRTGARYRLTRDANFSSANYNGQFVFSSLTAFQITQQGLRQHMTDQQIRATCVVGTNGIPTCGGASQFSITTGNPRASIGTSDLGVYAEDEWKTKPHLSLTFGLRIETQSAIPDHFDIAPRIGFAYSIQRKQSKSPLLVLRGGVGLFFTRFDSTDLLQAQRQNGVNQQAILVSNPVYTCAAAAALPCLTPSLPGATGQALSPTIYRVSPDLRTPINMQSLLTVERSFGKYGSISANYYHLRATHLYELLNVNAPVPSTGLRPFDGTQNIYQYSSQGITKWYLFSTNATFNLRKYANVWVYASAGHREQDAFGADQFPSNSYNLGADFATPATYVPQQLFAGVNAHPGRDTALNLFIGTYGRAHFNITTGQDNNGDSIYNDRPAFATDLTRKSVVQTSYGNFDTDPLAGQTIIPFNYGHTAALLYTELSASKTFRFGPRPAAETQQPAPAGKAPASSPRPYQLQFGIEADNVLNNVNPGPPVGVLTSPLFGRSLTLNAPYTQSSGANRTLLLHAKFSF